MKERRTWKERGRERKSRGVKLNKKRIKEIGGVRRGGGNLSSEVRRRGHW